MGTSTAGCGSLESAIGDLYNLSKLSNGLDITLKILRQEDTQRKALYVHTHAHARTNAHTPNIFSTILTDLLACFHTDFK